MIPSDQDSRLARVRKLLAKAEDTAVTPQEAEAYTAKVAELMASYGIDRAMLAASGVNVNLVFAITFAIGAGLAGLGGVIGAVELSMVPGEDTRFLLASLIVVIVGGMGSVVGAAIGAVMLGLAETFGLAYAPTYSVVFTFVILVIVLAFRPRGLMGRPA